VGRTDDPLEREADDLARRVVARLANRTTGGAVTQQHRPEVQRQSAPTVPRRIADLSAMSEEQLQRRYDRIAATLAGYEGSTPETADLEEEAGRIGVELGRRRAIAVGRTFAPESIERMRRYFLDNATSSSPDDCITTMNRGLRLLYDAPTQALGSDVQTTMARLRSAGRAGPGRVIEFEDTTGAVTRGVRRPERLNESVWDALIGLAGGDPGWSVFGLSILDGYHSVTLTLDNGDPARPRVYWSDQWSNRGGWQEFNRTELDAEIARWTRQWWDRHPASRKPRTRTTLWRLGQTTT
jgi:hypothetical protein